MSLIACLSLLSLSLNAAKNLYSWNNLSITLPFPKSWLSKKKKEKVKDPLVFLDVDISAPRIVANLYETSYSLSATDLSAFKAEFLSSKKRWLQKNEGNLDKEIILTYSNKFNTLRYEMSFHSTSGSFTEMGIFTICPKLGKIGLKVMIPKERIPRARKLGITSYLKNSSLCLL